MTGRPAPPTLFDVARTQPAHCPVGGCGAIRLPDQARVPTCPHDLDPESRRRPNGCLNAYRPEHAEVPF